jgi:NADH:ubiquinone reductase (H+-translocating)
MSHLISKIPLSEKPRIVIVGGGFAGLKLAMKLSKSNFQIILLDKNNYHQFQPLFYQVATAGLEPSSISFPLRKIFQNQKNIHFRVAEVISVDAENHQIETNIGYLPFDYLVLALGANTNFFGMNDIAANAIPMKSTPEALFIRNTILMNYENAVNLEDRETETMLMNIVVVGGGPTGVELAGALAEMRKYVLPKDYPELDFSNMRIHLLEASDRLLRTMKEVSSRRAQHYLEKLGVEVKLNATVKSFDGHKVSLQDGTVYNTKTLLWAAGIKANEIGGFKPENYGPGRRLTVNEYLQIPGHPDIFVIGDMAYLQTNDYPFGHPQVAQTAIQQASLIARNLKKSRDSKIWKMFRYNHKGSLATIGRNMGVADLPGVTLFGFTAWFVWIFVHLMAILGQKNKIFIFINWLWNYFTYDQSLRLILKQDQSKTKT